MGASLALRSSLGALGPAMIGAVAALTLVPTIAIAVMQHRRATTRALAGSQRTTGVRIEDA